MKIKTPLPTGWSLGTPDQPLGAFCTIVSSNIVVHASIGISPIHDIVAPEVRVRMVDGVNLDSEDMRLNAFDRPASGAAHCVAVPTEIVEWASRVLRDELMTDDIRAMIPA